MTCFPSRNVFNKLCYAAEYYWQILETEIHFKGLQEMVWQRGGINRISPVAAHQIAS
jgi:hypothetical protein